MKYLIPLSKLHLRCSYRINDSRRKERYEEILQTIPIFSTLNAYEASNVVDGLKPVTFKAGSLIIREVSLLFYCKGDEGEALYLLESGEAYAVKGIGPEKMLRKVIEYKAGSYFGESAFLQKTPRESSIYAKVRVCVRNDRQIAVV